MNFFLNFYSRLAFKIHLTINENFWKSLQIIFEKKKNLQIEKFHIKCKFFFEYIFQKEIEETLLVAELMGMKTVLNEFIAYQHLHELMSTGQLTGVS